jgi:hypothetical protein
LEEGSIAASCSIPDYSETPEGLLVAGSEFQVPGFRFQVSGFRFKVSGFRFKVTNQLTFHFSLLTSL